ncbi:2-keto-4-pentenoate hydratase [Sphingopyxis terrae]|uniref:2-keto-4-pentenoate hydratase n=1 Tax=Sphingopyxis terrae TaxID=33052 RepID=UPI002A0B5098|nr:fumarylacetoacetate hydrolase family protein [Sphingopyxis terrae]MDX8356502.1 fumarylacetoacetate hydrolase family protein [Sphingopyxis terrae]
MVDVQAIANRLVEDHRDRRPFRPYPSADLVDVSSAYAVQNAFLAARSGGAYDIGGWKIGLATPRMQAKTGVSEPVAGVVRAQDIAISGAVLDGSRYTHLGFETEICAVMGPRVTDLREFSRAEVERSIEAVGASFELVDDRNADFSELEALTLIADNVWNEGAVLASMIPFEAAPALSGRTGTLTRDGTEIARGYYDADNGDIVGIVTWLARSLHSRGLRLKPGQIVMTGTLFSPVFVVPGETYVFSVEGFDPVTISIA